MKRALTLSLVFYASLILERFLVHYPRSSLNLDSLYYSLAAIRFAEGNFGETFSGPWQPLLGWWAGVLVFLGIKPITAIAITAAFGGALAVGIMAGVAYRIAGIWGALLTGLGLSSDPQLLVEAAAVRSDALFTGLSALGFGWFAGGMISKPVGRLYLKIAILGMVLVLLRVAALPLVVLMGVLLAFVGAGDRKTRLSGTVLYFLAVTAVGSLLCLVYYRQFNLFIPSLNFALNQFYRVTEWMHIDPEGFCRLFDGRNTILGDLQFLDPTVLTLPRAPEVDSARLSAYWRSNVLGTFRLGWSVVPSVVWVGVLFGIWRLVREKKYALLFLGTLWILFSSGAQAFSTAQLRFCLPMVPLLYLLGGIGVAPVLKKNTRWATVGIVILNLWAGRIHMNPGFLLSGTFLNEPELIGDYVLKNYGPGHRVMSTGNYPSIISAKARWRTVPCVDPEPFRRYVKDKRIEFVILPRPMEKAIGGSLTGHFRGDGRIFDLEHETEFEVLYRKRPDG